MSRRYEVVLRIELENSRRGASVADQSSQFVNKFWPSMQPRSLSGLFKTQRDTRPSPRMRDGDAVVLARPTHSNPGRLPRLYLRIKKSSKFWYGKVSEGKKSDMLNLWMTTVDWI